MKIRWNVRNLRLLNKGEVPRRHVMATSCPVVVPVPAMKPVTENRNIRMEQKVILIKPVEETDKRNNEQIKMDLVKELDGSRNKLRIRGIRQMRNKGVILEVKDKKDVELVKRINLGRVGLATAEPNRLNPSIIIYDVEPEHKVEDLKEDLIYKNFEYADEKLIGKLKKKVSFKFCIKTSENKVHWVVQVPGSFYDSIITKTRIYMMWRTYKVKEYLSIIRCFKCHGYGHLAKNCEIPEQLCEMYGSKDHLKDVCPKKNTPQCVNCMRNKRKESNHSVRSALCPKYKRQVEVYRNKLKWD